MKKFKFINLFSIVILLTSACEFNLSETQSPATVPHQERWGIYSLNLKTNAVELLYSSPNEISKLGINSGMDQLAFSRKENGDDLENFEIFTLEIESQQIQRLTNNSFMDIYPIWSPDSSRIAYLAWPDSTIDIYMISTDGSKSSLFYDSGSHDADIDWVDNLIAFTRNSQIWVINSDGTGDHQITNHPRADEWGNANLPFGDYDPRISPDGSTILFERMIDDSSPNGNYDLFTIDLDGANLTNLTNNGYTQGLAKWSTTGKEIAFLISAIDDVGQYDLYMMNSDGSENRNITPAYFPQEFLIHWITSFEQDSLIYFIGEWWSEN